MPSWAVRVWVVVPVLVTVTTAPGLTVKLSGSKEKSRIVTVPAKGVGDGAGEDGADGATTGLVVSSGPGTTNELMQPVSRGPAASSRAAARTGDRIRRWWPA
ncbi:hypothetical protein GCM10010519_27600 [Streptomyces lactacystinicus]